MRQRLRCLAIVVAAGIAAGGLTACDQLKAESFQDDSTLSGKITSVRLEIGSGGATVNGTKGNGRLSLRRTVAYRGDRPQGASYRIEDGVLVLGGCGSHCSVTYIVDVPAGIPVSGKTSSGSVSVTRVGEVKVATSSGLIEMNDVSGPVEARTSNGRIRGRNIAGRRLQAKTSNGAIELSLATPQDVRAKTSNGHIDLTVPQAGYRVSAKNGNGSKNIDVTDDPSGRYRLDLTTSNGEIAVHHP
ncbi:DUF4097 family beta strand repeat-containing protein [Streptomyces colonosanans]|uniref:DUF4097 domain-containing protein n=1 Tax=Streptomyces colonosanans TaxID=1428652 RepID=A0A1S2PW50_9ACTN|nr:DUF4097 family beta strand repeat-containing protein [Streptomyces colonosanans]OIJ98049.1 hypothetical protein BIV24_06680 [Streptomyces colonosanans]